MGTEPYTGISVKVQLNVQYKLNEGMHIIKGRYIRHLALRLEEVKQHYEQIVSLDGYQTLYS